MRLRVLGGACLFVVLLCGLALYLYQGQIDQEQAPKAGEKPSPANPQAQAGSAVPCVSSRPTAQAPDPAGSAAVGATKTCVLCVVENPRLDIGLDGLASATVKVCNKGSAPEKFAPGVSDFTATGCDGKPFQLNAGPRLVAATAADKLLLEQAAGLPAKACVDLRLDAGKLLQAGHMSASLRNGGDDLATLTAVRLTMPFSLGIDGPNPAKLDLHLGRGQAASVRIRNNDVVAYPVRWRLELPDSTIGGFVQVMPKRTAELSLPSDWAQFDPLESGFLRPARSEGRLVLEREADPAFANLAMESVTFPVVATLRYHGPLTQTVVNALFVALFLFFGVLGSLAINYALPMQRRRVTLKQNLAGQEDTLNGQGNLIGSRPLGVLRVELRRLRSAVDAQSPFLPETESELPRIESRVEALRKRIDIARDAGKMLRDVRVDAALALHEAQDISDHCAAALATVEMASPSEADLQAAQASLAAAGRLLSATTMKPDAVAVAALLARADRVPATLGPLTAAPGSAVVAADDEQKIWQALEDLLADLRKGFLAKDVVMPLRADYVQAAQAVWKAELILAFAGMIDSAESAAVYGKRLQRAHELLDKLTPGPQESPKMAVRLLREIRQNVSKQDVLGGLSPAVGAGPTVVIEPRSPTEYQLTALRVGFAEPGLDAAEARRSITCRWTINGIAIEGDEFSVYHFFERPGIRAAAQDFKVEVTLCDGAKEVAKLATVTVSLTRSPNFLRSSTLLSLASLGITVLVVTIGLLATAQDKLQTLDWPVGLITLLGLGFGADVLKRVLSKA